MTVAYIVLFSWPLAVNYFFRQLTIPAAVAASIIGGYLLLPDEVGLNLPVLPNVNKHFIPAVAALIAGTLAAQRLRASDDLTVLPGLIPKPIILRSLLLILIGGLFMTSFTNASGLNYGPRSLPGLTIYDAFSTSLAMLVALLPFAAGRKFLADAEAHKKLLLVLCVASLCYSLLALYEVRMSPQLNKIIYGYSVSGWITNLRGDGYRPFVFLEHGLWLAIFMSYSLLATLGYIRATGRSDRIGVLVMATIWLLITLVLVKSLGALIIAILLAPLILFFGAGTQLLAAAVIAGSLLTYPALRGSGFIPTEGLVSLAEKIDPLRASSLAFRMRHEDSLLAKANQRPLFGWGGWGRGRVYNDKGQNLSVTDGRWTLIIGMGGWSRYIAEVGLMTIPIILLWARRRKYEVTLATSALALVMAANLVDLIPNATQTPVTWLIAGALAGRLELGRIATKRVAVVDQETSGLPASRRKKTAQSAEISYTRQTETKHRTKGRSD